MFDLIKKNYLIFIAFLIPISFITIYSILTLLPRALIKTEYNFSYYICLDEYNYPLDSNFCSVNFEKKYQIENNKIVINATNKESNLAIKDANNENTNLEFRFYIFNTKNFKSEIINENELIFYSLNNSRVSPDNIEFIVKNLNDASLNFPIGPGYNTNQYFLSNNLGSVRLNLTPDDFNDSYSFTNSINFIGWIEN
jgi:hypothetical protein